MSGIWLDMAIYYSNDLFIDYFTLQNKKYENRNKNKSTFGKTGKPPPPREKTKKDNKEKYYVELKSISQTLLTLNERYIQRYYKNYSINIDSKLKDKFYKIIFCSSAFFHNPNFTYSYQSHYINVNIATRKGEQGIYLFHKILKNYQMRNALSLVVNHFVLNNVNDNNTNDNDINNIFLKSDSNNKIAIESLVFGHYNEMYQNLKFRKNITKYQVELINMLHFIQYKTIASKFSNIN